ncbi:hypothetical protein FJY94_04370 [Candidatus Kaiserbacteria bacterium]|nr:hypothetical protein [Candidatus Kaiserbacteria bacterium]
MRKSSLEDESQSQASNETTLIDDIFQWSHDTVFGIRHLRHSPGEPVRLINLERRARFPGVHDENPVRFDED